MRFIVHGAGAVGGVLGARLHLAGHDVVLVARGRHLDAIRRDGLTLLSPDARTTVRPPAAERAEPRPGDVVLLATKSMDTEAALAGYTDPETPVVCVQNGVSNERAALRRFADVYGVCVMFPTSHLTPGVVVQHCAPTPGILDIGRYPSGVDTTAEGIAAAFRSAGFHSEPRADIMRWKYAKLLMNLGNAVQAACGRADGVDAVAERLRAEGRAVLAAAGIPYASDEEDRERRADILRVRPVEGVPRQGGSTWQSLARDTGSVESDHLNGEIVLLGRLHGVPAPLNERARQVANRMARDRLAPGTITPVEFITP